MRLILGGVAQGKFQYAKMQYGFDYEIWNHFADWFKDSLKMGQSPETEMWRRIQESEKEVIILAREIGNGIVPIDAFEREYRERYGRALCQLAAQAESVERMVCGIAQQIK